MEDIIRIVGNGIQLRGDLDHLTTTSTDRTAGRGDRKDMQEMCCLNEQ